MYLMIIKFLFCWTYSSSVVIGSLMLVVDERFWDSLMGPLGHWPYR